MTLIRYGLWSETRSFEPDASIVLIGARGSGKRSLGFIGATKLGRRFITEDHYFESITGLTRGDYLQKHGGEEFYRQNVEIVRHMLFDNRKRCVIECGMGSLAGNAQVLIRQFAKTNPVIYVTRNSKSITRLLKLDDFNAQRLEQADLSHRFCSNLEYYNLYDATCEEISTEPTPEQDRRSPTYSFKLKNAKQDFSNFLDFVTGRAFAHIDFESPFSITAVPAEMRPYTYALPIRLSDFLNGGLDLDEISMDSGGDVVELKIDVQPPENLKAVAKLVALIKRKMQLPIIFSVDRELRRALGDASYSEILQYGLRLGLEYVAMDTSCPSESIQRLIKSKGRTKCIGDYFDDRQSVPNPWSDGFLMTQYVKAKTLGCDLVRITRQAARGDNNDDLEQFRVMVRSSSGEGSPLPLIAYSIGAMGHISQISNLTFTPITAITHSDLGGVIKKDPESLSAQEAMQALFWRHELDPLHFYIVGASVYYSLSPAMHNAAYRICGMNHDYSIRQSSSLDELHQLAQDANFGGAAISHPFKVGIVSKLKAMSKHASTIGAVNTLVPIRALPDGSVPDDNEMSLKYQANRRGRAGPVVGWFGDNTDWIGIMNCLQRNLSPRNAVQRKSTGLVIGAGGMARAAIYAMIHLGCRKVFIYNRTLENAEKVAAHFNSYNLASAGGAGNNIVEVLRSPNDQWPPEFNPPTLIVSAIPAHSVKDRPAANFIMPEQWLKSPSGGVVIELAYKPLITPLLQQVQLLREAGQPWTIVDGLEILPEQGIAQFELMTGRRAPRQRMRLEILRRYKEELDTDNHRIGDAELLRNRFEKLQC